MLVFVCCAYHIELCSTFGLTYDKPGQARNACMMKRPFSLTTLDVDKVIPQIEMTDLLYMCAQ